MSTPAAKVDKTVSTRVAKLKTEQIQKRLQSGEFNEAEIIAAKDILKQRGVKEEKKPAEKKAAAPKKEPSDKPAAPKKKSEKIGETKSDKMRTMLRAGKTTGEIIKGFLDEGITVRYPEIRRNRLWLEEKEQWVNPHADTEKKAKEPKEPKPEKKAAAPKKEATPKKEAVKKEAPTKKTATPKAKAE